MDTTTHSPKPLESSYDAVVIGARCAGAATGMLLARSGLDVLVIDRAARGQDTLSSHALMRGAVDALERWGVLPRIVAAGTPSITRTSLRYGTDAVALDIDPLYAPRRTVLDPLVADVAVEAGATVRYQTAAAGLLRDDMGRVTGIVVDDVTTETSGLGDGPKSISAGIVIGADGLRSWMARQVDAPVTRAGTARSGAIMSYVEGAELADDEYLWAAAEGVLGGVIPTNHDQHMLFASLPGERFVSSVRGRTENAYLELLAELGDDLYQAAVGARRVGPLRTFPGQAAQFRKPHGPGWALVGDAGYFKDPAAAHGIADAFRDAELLSEAIIDGDLGRYEQQRDELSTGLFTVLERIAGFDWSLDELPALHRTMSNAMRSELIEFESRHLLASPALPAAA